MHLEAHSEPLKTTIIEPFSKFSPIRYFNVVKVSIPCVNFVSLCMKIYCYSLFFFSTCRSLALYSCLVSVSLRLLSFKFFSRTNFPRFKWKYLASQDFWQMHKFDITGIMKLFGSLFLIEGDKVVALKFKIPFMQII